jgi:hypothetical protein
MNITLILNREVEKGLLARAQARGISLDAYLDDLVKREAGVAELPTPPSGKDKARAFAAWARSHRSTPLLSDADVGRAAMYTDRV